MSGVQLIGVGNVNTLNAAEVETNTKALRVIPRAIDYGTFGIYGSGFRSNVMAAGLVAASPIFSFRYPAAFLCLVKRVLISAVNVTTGFTAGTGKFDLFAARSWTVADTGGNNISPNTNTTFDMHKMRPNMGTSGMVGTNILISSTAALTAGTRTLDAQPLASLVFPCSATANAVMVPPQTPLWDQRAVELPLVLAQNEGFVIQATVPATGTWQFALTYKWVEVAAY